MPTFYNVKVNTCIHENGSDFCHTKRKYETESGADTVDLTNLASSDAAGLASFIIDRIQESQFESIFGDVGKELHAVGAEKKPRYFRLKKIVHDHQIMDGAAGHKVTYYYDEWQCQPLLEGIYENAPDSFYKIIDALNQDDVSEEKRQEFLTCLQELPSSISSSFLTKREGLDELEGAINELQRYNEGRNKKDPKFHAAETLIQELKLDLTILRRPYKSGTSPTKQSLLTLKRKLVMKKAIMDSAPALNKHQGYKRLLTNILTALCGFIPNVINCMATGNFLFFNRTDTQKRADAIDNALTVEPKRTLVSQ